MFLTTNLAMPLASLAFRGLCWDLSSHLESPSPIPSWHCLHWKAVMSRPVCGPQGRMFSPERLGSRKECVDSRQAPKGRTWCVFASVCACPYVVLHPSPQDTECAHVPAQSCPTLCYPMDCSPPGSSVHGISQAKILEDVAIFFSRASSQPRNWTCDSCVGRFFTIWTSWEAHRTECQNIS